MTVVESMIKEMSSKYNDQRMGIERKPVNDGNFIDFLTRNIDEAGVTNTHESRRQWYKLRNKLIECYSDNIPFSNINKQFLEDFIDFLKTCDARCHHPLKTPKKMAAKSISVYYDFLRSAINQAFKEGLLTRNPTRQFSLSSKVKVKENNRQFLELSELKQLMLLSTKYDMEKRAFLFACLCGLRSSDIRNLTWEQFPNRKKDITITIKMEKTDEYIHLPISHNALRWLPKRGNAKATDKVFPLIDEGKVNAKLRKMMAALGIDKHITFHCSRHTFATMMLTLGADLYTVSKLLGHQNIEVTQVYAKIVDKKKEEAVNLIPSLRLPAAVDNVKQ